jgi:hypothetical protein
METNWKKQYGDAPYANGNTSAFKTFPVKIPGKYCMILRENGENVQK